MFLLTIITAILLSNLLPWLLPADQCASRGSEDALSTGVVPRRTENVCPPQPPTPPQPASLQGASDGLRVQCGVL